MALVAVLGARTAIGDATDIFNQAAPLITDAPQQATPTLSGDESVSPTGSLEYNYPIDVPPGRAGMQPHLSLHYSSAAPIYGALASGWSIEQIPAVMLDTRAGRLKSPYYSPPLKIYKTSPGEQQLVPTSDTTSGGAAPFRAIHDGAFTRYELMPFGSSFKWRAYTTDGQTMYFGDSDHAPCSTISDEYAPLTRQNDAFGNAVEYFYEPGADGECRIRLIQWGQNAAASIASFASVSFVYNPSSPSCASGFPVGSQSNYRSGTKIVTGGSELDQIVIKAYLPGAVPDHTRQITLAYDANASSCSAQHSAYRSLASIQESAWGVDSPRVDLPAIAFTYGAATSAYQTTTRSVPWQAFLGPYGVQSYNLGWGRRFELGQPTVEAMMVDIDGDGLLDRLTNAPVRDAQGRTVSCQAGWERNRGPGYTNFEAPRYIEMPTLKWSNRDPAHPYQGGPYAGDDSDTADRCALNYLETGYINAHTDTGNFCPNPDGSNAGCPSSGICPNKTDCQPKPASRPPTILSFRWIDLDGDGLVDLVASPTKGGLDAYNFIQGNGVVLNPEGLIPAPPEPELFGPVSQYPPCPTTPYSAEPGGLYTMCGGMYPYFVYKNHGNGVFGTHLPTYPPTLVPDTILWEPIPLEPDAGDSTINSQPTGSIQGILDLDGDGYNDAILKDFTYARWDVYRNDQTGNSIVQRGQFTPNPTPSPFGGPFLFNTAPNSYLNFTFVDTSDLPIQTAGFLDANGDGLVDHWMGSGTNGTQAPFTIDINDGLHFRVGEITAAVRPGTDAFPMITSRGGPPSHYIYRGRRVDRGRTLDIDGDGRPDVAAYTGLWSTDTVSCPDANPPPTPTTYFNQGGQFGGAVVAPIDNRGFTHLILASEPNQGNVGLSWEVRSDIIDLDGDGISEGVYFQTGCSDTQPTSMSVSAVASTDPPRLLVKIDNARGATTTISYASISNSAVVEQHPELGKTMPHTRWVVKSVTAHDLFANTAPTDTTTTYKYVSPRWLADEQGAYALRGFDEIDATLPSGAVHVDRYSYTPDFSGRVVQSLVHPAEAPSEARTIDSTTWEARTLFGGAVTTYHATVHEHLTCKNGQTEATCTPIAAAAYTRSSSTLSACGSTSLGGSCDVGTQPSSASLLWIETRSLLSLDPNGNALDEDRETLSSYAVYADASSYRVRALTTTKNHRSGGVMVMYGKSAHTWDTAFLVPLTDEVWFDTNDANRAITRRVYDMSTGNILERWKPLQNAANSTRLVNTYDSRKLFVATEVDEKSLQRDHTYEYGTGAKLITAGPNVRTCTQNCPNDGLHPLKETHQIRVDGLGRPIERWEGLSTDGSIYTMTKIGTTSYVDSASGSTPTSATTQNLITYDSPSQTQNKTEMDGHGRAIRKTAYVQGSAPANQITNFHYRTDGTLQDVTLPDPTANNASTVTYTYGFDSLGRPTSIRRPDSTTSPSGINLSYDGVTKTATEVVGAAGGQIAITQTKTDSFGRLIEVDEQLTASPLAWAMTTYSYTPDDNVSQILDPEGLTTQLQHDFAGHRTAIVRGGRTWTYTYDKNGNMTVEQVPGSTGPLDDVNYKQTTVYDDLDRTASKLNGARTLSGPDQALFGVDHETFIWDYPGNRKGRLVYWSTYAPGASTPTTTLQNGYDAQGNLFVQIETMNFAGFPANMQRSTRTDANLLGAPWVYSYSDQVGGSNSTTGRVYFDLRGLPQKYVLQRTGMANQDVAVQTRNVAGFVTKRHTDLSGAMTFVESNWTYDKLGRVASQVVQKGPGPTQVARQDLAYFGNDDPSSLDDWLGATNHKQFHYTFDLRHQLLGVSETAQGGVFAATYTFGNAGRFTTALENAASLPGSDVKPRSVSYLYGDANDRERVTALTNTSNGTTYASYNYDQAGNQTNRTYPATSDSWDYSYDGKDQLRRATKKHANVVTGSEEYWYDGTGRRIAVVKRDASGNRTEMIWFLNETEAHYDGAGNLVHVYSHLSLGTPVARIDRTGNTSTSLEFQFHGLASNTLAAVDQGGTINASFTYAPFGEIVEATDAGAGAGAGVLAHRRRMNDKYLDELTDLAYYGVRFYDKTLIAWTQGDQTYRFSPDAAWSQPRRGSLYSFNLANPLRYQDPDGREPVNLKQVYDAMSAGSAQGVNERMTELHDFAQLDADSPSVPSAASRTATAVVNTEYAIAEFVFEHSPIGKYNGLQCNAPSNSAAETNAFEGGDLPDIGFSSSSLGAGGGGAGGGAGASGGGPGGAGLDPPDHYTVVRGGESPMPPAGKKFSGATGIDLKDAAQGVPHGKIRETTAGRIRDEGGNVTRKAEPTRSGKMNEKHVDICLGDGPCPFSDIKENPVPKKERVE